MIAKFSIRNLPLIFSTLGMLSFILIWCGIFSNPQQANSLSMVPLAFLTSGLTCLAFASFCQRHFSRVKTNVWRRYVFGIGAAVGSHIAVTFTFVSIIFAASSVRDRIVQWGVAYFYSAWLLLFGAPISIALGLVYGFALNRGMTARSSLESGSE